VAVMATFSAQGMMEYLGGMKFHVWITDDGIYKAARRGYKEISFREYFGKADSITAGGKPFSDIDKALEYAKNGC